MAMRRNPHTLARKYMMEYEDEQALEREGLRCMYSHGELSDIDQKTLKLRLVPVPGSLNDKGVNLVEVSLWLQYTEKYPDDPPVYRLEDARGLDAKLMNELSEKIEAVVESHLGTPMIYGIAEEIQASGNVVMIELAKLELQY